MDIILWRHADAEPGANDMARKLTPQGEKDAAAMAKWLRARLPSRFTLVASPAVRAQQTASPLGAPVTEIALAPGASPGDIKTVAEKHKGVVVIVGHQPDLGRAAARFCGASSEWSIEKGAIFWMAGDMPCRIKAALTPDLV